MALKSEGRASWEDNLMFKIICIWLFKQSPMMQSQVEWLTVSFPNARMHSTLNSLSNKTATFYQITDEQPSSVWNLVFSSLSNSQTTFEIQSRHKSRHHIIFIIFVILSLSGDAVVLEPVTSPLMQLVNWSTGPECDHLSFAALGKEHCSVTSEKSLINPFDSQFCPVVKWNWHCRFHKVSVRIAWGIYEEALVGLRCSAQMPHIVQVSPWAPKSVAPYRKSFSELSPKGSCYSCLPSHLPADPLTTHISTYKFVWLFILLKSLYKLASTFGAEALPRSFFVPSASNDPYKQKALRKSWQLVTFIENKPCAKNYSIYSTLIIECDLHNKPLQ